MGMFDKPVKVTGEHSFSFTTFIWEHPWDNKDYAYFHDVNEDEGKKMYKLLSKELGATGKSMEDLLKAKFGKEPDADQIFDYCKEHDISYDFSSSMI